jgi:hypothetical protein
MASRIMPIPTDQQLHPGRGKLPAVLLSVTTLAVIAQVAIFLWPDSISATSRYIRGQQTTSGTRANNPAAEDQFIALLARLTTLLENAMRDNADLAQQLRATQTQMARDNALVAEQLKTLTQMAHRPGVLAMGSDERERRHRTNTRKLMPEVSRPEVTDALAARRRPAGALFPATVDRSPDSVSSPASQHLR